MGNKTGCKKKILFKVQFFPKNWLTAKHGKGLKKMNNCSILLSFAVPCTSFPKISFLYFISLHFSMIGLGKQIISTKVVFFQYNSLFSYLLCHLLTRIIIRSVYFRAKSEGARVYVTATYFLYFIAHLLAYLL